MATFGEAGTGNGDVAFTNHVRVTSGQFSPGAGSWQLDSIVVRGGTSAVNGARLALYKNSVNDVDGATLVEDLGTTSIGSNSWATVNSGSNPALANGDYLFLAVKGTNASGNLRSNSSATGFTYWENPSGESADETVGWGATLGAESFNIGSYAICIYINYSAVGGGPVGSPWYYYSQQ